MYFDLTGLAEVDILSVVFGIPRNAALNGFMDSDCKMPMNNKQNSSFMKAINPNPLICSGGAVDVLSSTGVQSAILYLQSSR